MMEGRTTREGLRGVSLAERIRTAAAMWMHCRLEVHEDEPMAAMVHASAVRNAMRECALVSSEYQWVLEESKEIEADVEAGRTDLRKLREEIRRFHERAYF